MTTRLIEHLKRTPRDCPDHQMMFPQGLSILNGEYLPDEDLERLVKDGWLERGVAVASTTSPPLEAVPDANVSWDEGTFIHPRLGKKRPIFGMTSFAFYKIGKHPEIGSIFEKYIFGKDLMGRFVKRGNSIEIIARLDESGPCWRFLGSNGRVTIDSDNANEIGQVYEALAGMEIE